MSEYSLKRASKGPTALSAIVEGDAVALSASMVTIISSGLSGDGLIE